MSGLGYWLDNEVDCVPLFTLIGTIFGLAVGMYHVIMEARRVEKKDEANKK